MADKIQKVSTAEMEYAVAAHFGWRRNLIVPNISWGMELHECDLLILTGASYAYEVEIKVSKADLIKDGEKRHGHHSHKIKYLYFAIPHYLSKHIEHIPKRAGIIVVALNKWGRYACAVERKPAVNSKYKFTEQERCVMARLGALRMWDLKHTISVLLREIKYLKSSTTLDGGYSK